MNLESQRKRETILNREHIVGKGDCMLFHVIGTFLSTDIHRRRRINTKRSHNAKKSAALDNEEDGKERRSFEESSSGRKRPGLQQKKGEDE